LKQTEAPVGSGRPLVARAIMETLTGLDNIRVLEKTQKPSFVVGVYARLSQHEGNPTREPSLKRQVDAVRKESEKRDWQIYGVYEEVVSGAVPFKDREEGGRLIKDAE